MQLVLLIGMKRAKDKPIFKKDDKKQQPGSGNNRPVSLTSIVCKAFEGFICDTLSKHLKTNGSLFNHQHEFTTGRSCITQLLTTCASKMTGSRLLMMESLQVDVIYIYIWIFKKHLTKFLIVIVIEDYLPSWKGMVYMVRFFVGQIFFFPLEPNMLLLVWEMNTPSSMTHL